MKEGTVILAHIYSFVHTTIITHMYFVPAEKLWMSVHNTTQSRDQTTLNYALQNLGVQWKRITTVKNICHEQSGWHSYGPLNCMVFSQDDVCRGCCGDPRKHNYYIFHPVTDKVVSQKKHRYQNSKVWFLKYGWKELISSSSEGTVWLRSVSTLNDG